MGWFKELFTKEDDELKDLDAEEIVEKVAEEDFSKAEEEAAEKGIELIK